MITKGNFRLCNCIEIIIICRDVEWTRGWPLVGIRAVLCTLLLTCKGQRVYFAFRLIAWKSVEDNTITSFKL